MACYLNPRNVSIDAWLKFNGVSTGNKPGAITATHLPVCHTISAFCDIAPIAFDENELTALTRSYDMRPKQWFTVPIVKLRDVSDIHNYRDLNGYLSDADLDRE